MQGDYWIINSEQKLKNFKEFLDGAWEANHWLQVQVKTGKTRTVRQNAALHAWFRDLAKVMRNRGVTFTIAIRWGDGDEPKYIEVDATEELVKEILWGEVQEAILGFRGTSKLSTDELSMVYEPINRKLAEYGVHIPLGEEFIDANSSTAGP